MGEKGWPFASVDEYPGADVDPLYGSEHAKDLYLRADPNYSGRFLSRVLEFKDPFVDKFRGRFTVPVLWDKKNHTIVNNESSEIIRMFNTGFNDLIPADKAKIDIYPEELREEIDSVNQWVYDGINSQSSRSPPRFGVNSVARSRWGLQSRFREHNRSI